MPLDQTLFDRLAGIVGAKACISDPADMAPYIEDQRGLFHHKAALVVRPASTAEVAQVVAACAAAGVAVVPQGGNTGLCGGALPHTESKEIIINLGRLNRIRGIDPVNYTITVDAGCILADIQHIASENDCLFPLSLGAEGSCMIGGNLSTNAGGTNVLRYGNARDLVLGLEVVLPDGRIWNGLRALRKDNTGYALRHVFAGAEGTLGIITGAALKLFPKPKEIATALCALTEIERASILLGRARAVSGDAVTAFEFMARSALEMSVKHIPGCTDPFDKKYPWYVLIEFATSRADSDLRASFDTLMESALTDGLIVDAVIAQSMEQNKALWRLRESLNEAQKPEGGSIKHDVSVPVSLVPEFVARGIAAVKARFPDARPVPFGHFGDGNIHFNFSQPVGGDTKAYLAHWGEMNRIVHDIVTEMGGSISAEHGVGQLKVEEIKHYKDPVEIDLMRKLKRALDPANLMNPGKVIN